MHPMYEYLFLSRLDHSQCFRNVRGAVLNDYVSMSMQCPQTPSITVTPWLPYPRQWWKVLESPNRLVSLVKVRSPAQRLHVAVNAAMMCKPTLNKVQND